LKLKIDGILCEGARGETLMEVARRNNIYIPSLCYKKGFEGLGRCRLCLVEVKESNRKRLVSSCAYPIKEGIEVTTNTDEIKRIRKNIIMLLLLRAPNNKYIQRLGEKYKVSPPERYMEKTKNEDCILCGLCVKACERMGMNAISFADRGIAKTVSTPYDNPSMDCIGCEACVEVCPTGAIKAEERNKGKIIWNRRFIMVKCSVCGKEYIKESVLKVINRKLNTEQEPICESCRRKAIASKFKDSFQDVVK